MFIRDWLRPPRSLLVLFLGTTLVLTAGLGWLGWRLLQQDRAVDAQRVRDRLDSSADLITAEIRQTLSATEAQLTRFSTLSASGLEQAASEYAEELGEDALVVVLRPGAVDAYPTHRLLFYPAVPRPEEPIGDAFAAGEAREFRARDFESAIADFRRLSDSDDEQVRAGALLRLARNQRKAGHPEAALKTYTTLGAMERGLLGGQPAEPAGEPQLLIANLDVGSGMGVTRDGTLHYPVRVTRRRLKITELDVKTGRLLRQPVNVTDRFVGSNKSGEFSPDGETLAYISERRGWQQRAIVVRSLKTGEERDLPHDLRYVGLRSWRSGGDRLLVEGTDDRGRNGYFEVDVATGQTRPLPDMPDMGRATFTPDGTQILHRQWSKNRESIFSYSVVDGSVQALPGVFPGGRFSLSPDGKWIATLGGHRSPGDNHGTEMRLHPAVGGDGDVLWTTDEAEPFGRWTTWTPDGTALLVLKQEPEAGEHMWRLWVVPVDGPDPVATELVHEPANGGAYPLDIHPDGKRIVYAAGGYFRQFWALRNLALDQPDSP